LDGVELMAASEVAPAINPDDPLVGRELADRYQVRRAVARGGMGCVYEAFDRLERRRVALKILHRNVMRDRIAVERFKREYEISKLLPHEHIVEVFDFLPVEGLAYVLVMDFLEGEELSALLAREGTMRPGKMVRVFSQIAVGLGEAHGRQLIHRDIKPENVFLCGTHAGDVVKLLDFGSVKDNSDGAKKLTMMGTTVGSPYYMSPEQAQGLDTLDSRTDVWSLAAIAYESLTGRVPFAGRCGPSILLAILTEEPRPASVVAEEQPVLCPVPTAVDAAFLEAFAKEPASRVATVGLLVDKLGVAYGLDGTHRDWAYTSECLLEERVEPVLSELVRARGAQAVVEDDPFSAPIKSMPLRAEMEDRVEPSVRARSQQLDTVQLQAVGVPKKLSPVLAIAWVVGLLVVVAIVVAIVCLL